MDIRIGYGIDVHQLADGHSLFIGGVKIDSSFGAVGHSDADALLHAICDALLGALALRDIGYHFSDKDPKFKGIDSKLLLEEVVEMIHNRGFYVSNIDTTVVLETPKLSSYIERMQLVIAEILDVSADRVSIKATTHEKVDSFGEGRAIKAFASCLLVNK
jgi:2-C-methyl-D-erythritol 2,4-cyclodiphosphate synthase